MKMLTVRLDDREAAALAALCEELGVSRSEVVKRAIMDLARAARRKPFGEAAAESGLIGCFSGPRDLAQNHQKYLRKAFRAKAGR